MCKPIIKKSDSWLHHCNILKEFHWGFSLCHSRVRIKVKSAGRNYSSPPTVSRYNRIKDKGLVVFLYCRASPLPLAVPKIHYGLVRLWILTATPSSPCFFRHWRCFSDDAPQTFWKKFDKNLLAVITLWILRWTHPSSFRRPLCQ